MHKPNVLKTLAVICLMTSLTACGTLRQKPTPPSEAPAICPSSAFVDPKDYEVAPLASKSDVVFHQWVGENYIAKLPTLKIAYTDLLECWNHYHPTKETK